jgi:hypothetical protein
MGKRDKHSTLHMKIFKPYETTIATYVYSKRLSKEGLHIRNDNVQLISIGASPDTKLIARNNFHIKIYLRMAI